MCGIFGNIGEIDKDTGRRCLDTLKHRGPDSEGIFHNDDVFLGHRRLSIIDLSTEAGQPMSYKNGRYEIVFNGEIYNFLELRTELIALGHTFKTDGDTEVILAAFTEWGEACLDKFNGMWALAIWDTKKKELFLSRDRFGKKPLFYTKTNRGFAFASEMKALAPLLETITPDTDIINDTKHIFYYESTSHCLVKEIVRFPAGHYGWLRNNELTLTRWWHTLDHLEEVPKTYEAQVAKFRELFLDACKIRMRSDVPIGTALSGGLDSSAVFCALAHLSKESDDSRINHDWQHAFCASFPETPLDESYWARRVAEHCNTKIDIVTIEPEESIADFYNQCYLFEELYITPHIPFMATYAAMRKDGVVVTIDGHGADELFGGYSFDFLHSLYDNIFNLRRSKEIIDTYYDTQITDENQFTALPPKYMFWLKQLIKNIGKRVLRHKNQHPDMNHPNWEKLDYATQKLYISFHQTVLPTLLRNYDRYSMANGVEIRMPFMDHRLVTYAFSLGWNAKLRNGYTKAIIRDALSDIMPEDVVWRKTKVGFNAPMVNWIQGPLRDFFTKILVSKEFQQSSFIDQEQSKREIENIMNNDKATFSEAETAWMHLAPFFWEEGFLNKIKGND